MWQCALVSCTPSQSIGLVLGCALLWCWVSLCVPFIKSLIEYFIILVVTIIGIIMVIILIPTYRLRLSESKRFWVCKCAPPWMFPPLYITFENRIRHVASGLLYVMFRLSTRISYRKVPGFATDYPPGAMCRGFTTCLLYVGPFIGNLVWNDSGLVNLT